VLILIVMVAFDNLY